jgi:hypothetical protein
MCFMLVFAITISISSPAVLHVSANTLPPDEIHRHNLLDVTSMWGMGVDARKNTTRRTRVPLVTWTKSASDMLERAWVDMQHSMSCNRALYMYPYHWGLTSQMRDYSDAAIASLATRRKLLFVQDARRPKWCAKDAWLECYFQPLSGESCRRKLSELRDTPQFAANGAADMLAMLASDAATVHVVNRTRFDYVVDHPALFPYELWEKMLANRDVIALDTFGESINMGNLKTEHPELYHTLSLSALRTMLAPVIFKPTPDILAIARARASELMQTQKQCVAVHLRWTNKKADQGVSARMEHNVDTIPASLDRLERRTGRSYRCLILLSDDWATATRQLMTKLGDTYDVKPVSRLNETGTFISTEEYDIYRVQGHTYFEQHVLLHDPDRAYAYAREVIVEIVAASLASDYLMGVGSSGVSQILAQYIGAKRRVDANALAVWQEDMLML